VEPQLVLAFEYLRRRFDAPIPASVFDALRARQPGRFELAWLDSLLRRGDSRSLAAQYGRYLRGARADAGMRRWVGGLPEHLTYLLGCDSPRRLPAEITSRVTTRALRSLPRRGDRGRAS